MSDYAIQKRFHTERAAELLDASQTGPDYSRNGPRKTYLLLTFPVMLEVRKLNAGSCVVPFIFSLDDTLASIQDCIRRQFNVRNQIKLEVVWRGSDVSFAPLEGDWSLVQVNTQLILRLLHQRGGVDKLLAKEEAYA